MSDLLTPSQLHSNYGRRGDKLQIFDIAKFISGCCIWPNSIAILFLYVIRPLCYGCHCVTNVSFSIETQKISSQVRNGQEFDRLFLFNDTLKIKSHNLLIASCFGSKLPKILSTWFVHAA